MATLMVKAFDSVGPRQYSETANRKEEPILLSSTYSQWDITEVRPDFCQFGYMEAWQTKDLHRPRIPGREHASGRYMSFWIRVPSISVRCKEFIESNLVVWPVYGRTMARRAESGEDEKTPVYERRRGFFLEFDSLPEWAKISMLCEGNCTLNEVDARNAIKHKLDSSLVPLLFESFWLNG